VWETYLGDELYVSPSYADDKLYVVTDQRSIYVLNATNGEKLSRFETGSNSWSSPTLYERKLYVGNNDWNVYCLSEYPALNSSLTIKLAKPKIVLGEKATGFGHLIPGMANTPIVVSFVKPDGTVIDMQVVTSKKGAFNFTYTPDVVGNWTVVAWWQSDKGYYTSSYSELALMEVTAAPEKKLPAEYIYAAVIALAAIAAVLLGYAYVKRGKE
jgi:outer membrane protein assembly factor BamB